MAFAAVSSPRSQAVANLIDKDAFADVAATTASTSPAAAKRPTPLTVALAQTDLSRRLGCIARSGHQPHRVA